MTMFWKSRILTFWSHPLSPCRGSGTGLGSKITFDMFHIYYTSVCNCYNIDAFTIPFDVQHYHVLKKFHFDLLMREGGCGRIISYHVAAFAIPFCLSITILWKSWILTFWPPGLGGREQGFAYNICYYMAAFAIPFNLICNMTMFCKMEFDLLIPRVGEGGLRAKYLLICYCMRDCHLNMQHDHVLKKLNFDLWPRPLNPPGGQTQTFDQKSGLKYFLFIVPLSAFDTILLHLRFPLICNMTMFRKNEFWPSEREGGGGGLRAKYLLPCCCIGDSL